MANKFTNPLTPGVTYKEFLESIPKGKSVKVHLKGKLKPEIIDWIAEEIKNYKNEYRSNSRLSYESKECH